MPTQSPELKQGLVAMRSGDKSKAWELMFPLAQAGDVQAMFYLGEMMLRSPEYGDNLERALKFFTVAAEKGHAGAKELVPRVKKMLVDAKSGSLPTIAGMSGTATKAEVDNANAKLAQYKAQVLRYTDALTDAPDIPRIDLMVFIAKTDSTAERIYSVAQGLENQFGNKIKVRFYVVINPSDWKPESAPIGGTKLPPNGFTPDFKGQLAAQHGVRNLPSVVVVPPKGQEKVVDDLSSLSNLISNLL
ncbi:SEL1-like repeat protein [Pseudomonas syringae pv. actinidiae]|nr:SEL1-like repeat protein [Pseudomonas syringae pv. actinidiae]